MVYPLPHMTTRMKAERLRRGWNQTVLAAKVGMSAADISRIESGRARPYPGQADRLAKVLKLAASRLQDQVPDAYL